MRWIISFALVCVIAQAQEPDRASVPFSNPSGPKTVKVHILNGAVTVKGYSGNEVVVEALGRGNRSSSVSPSGGMHRIETRGSGLQVEEDNNVVEITTGAMNRTSDLVIKVPSQVSLRVGTTNNGGIEIENVVGDIDAQALNGPVTIRNVSGAVVAHSLNGKVVVTLDQITAGKPMSFSTLNGDIDVTLPASTKANVKMKTDNGDIYTDFDIAITPGSNKPDVDNGGSKGKYRVRFDHGTYGAINGGGPEFQFTTLNGRIYIRKK